MVSVISTVNKSLVAKKTDEFYVSFLQLPENVSNILGRQVRGIDRPSINFDQAPVGHKNVKQQTVGQILFDPLQIEFIDDANSLALTALYSQIFRQAGSKVAPDDKVGDDARFSVRVDVYGPDQTVVEHFTLLGCLITTINSSQGIYSSAEDNIISVSVVYDNIDFGLIT